jgi:hypothetical protein
MQESKRLRRNFGDGVAFARTGIIFGFRTGRAGLAQDRPFTALVANIP